MSVCVGVAWLMLCCRVCMYVCMLLLLLFVLTYPFFLLSLFLFLFYFFLEGEDVGAKTFADADIVCVLLFRK